MRTPAQRRLDDDARDAACELRVALVALRRQAATVDALYRYLRDIAGSGHAASNAWDTPQGLAATGASRINRYGLDVDEHLKNALRGVDLCLADIEAIEQRDAVEAREKGAAS